MATIFVLLSVSIAIHAMSPLTYSSRFNSLYKGTLPSQFLKIRDTPKIFYMDKRAPGTFLNWALSPFRPWQNMRSHITYRVPGTNRPISFVATMGKRKYQVPRMVRSF